jgi:hypothetical protein
MDEVWAFIGKKEKRVRPENDQNLGDCYTFVANERNTKLVLNIAMGKRDQSTTDVFFEGVRDAIAPGCSLQITTGGFARTAQRSKHVQQLRGLRNVDKGVSRRRRRRAQVLSC